jgi:hypothetical protein
MKHRNWHSVAESKFSALTSSIISAGVILPAAVPSCPNASRLLNVATINASARDMTCPRISPSVNAKPRGLLLKWTARLPHSYTLRLFFFLDQLI